MKKIYLFKIVFLLFVFTTIGIQSSSAQIGIGTITPSAKSALDITSTTTGVLFPRVTTAQRIAIAPAVTDTGLKVYDTTTKSYWYWDGTVWVDQAANNNWKLTGNAGTVPGTNFIGTTDGVDFRIRTAGSDRFNISNTNGQLQSYGLGTAATPAYSFQGDQNTGVFSPGPDQLSISTNSTETVRVIANGNVGINKVAPTEKLDVVGNMRLSGALMPNNLSGTTDQALISAGANAPAIWTPFIFGNQVATTVIGKYYSSFTLPNGAPGNWADGTTRQFIINGVGLIRNSSAVTINFTGPYNAALHNYLTINNIITETDQMRVFVTNNTGATIGGGSTIPVSLIGFF